jgi:hypothetical protein
MSQQPSCFETPIARASGHGKNLTTILSLRSNATHCASKAARR